MPPTIDSIQAQLDSLESQIRDTVAHLREIMKLNIQASDSAFLHYDKRLNDQYQTLTAKIELLASAVAHLQQSLSCVASDQELQDIERRLRTIEVEFSAFKGNEASDKENNAVWLVVGMALLSSLLSVASSIIMYLLTK